MADEITNTLPISGVETTTITPPEPPVETSPPVETTGGALTPGVDTTPDPAKLKAEISELEERRKKAEEDAIYWRKQKSEARGDFFKGKPEEKGPSAPAALGPEPNPADFDDYNKYVIALTDHRVKVAKQEWDRENEQTRASSDQKTRMENLHTKMQDGFTKYADFEEVAFDRTASHITPMIVDILADCDHPADVAYYLAKNRVEGVAISKMTPLQAARAITRIEDKLTGSTPPPPIKPNTTKAPPPINALGSGGSGGLEKDPEKMNNKEYAAWREAQGARRF